MQRLPRAGVKLNYPLLSDITKGISAEYEVSQPHSAFPRCVSAKHLQQLPYPHARLLHCHTKSALLPPLQQLHCLGCYPLSHFPVMHSTRFMTVCIHLHTCCCVPSSVRAQHKECCAAFMCVLVHLWFHLQSYTTCLRPLPAAGAD